MAWLKRVWLESPNLAAGLVDGFLQDLDVGSFKPSQKVTRRGGIRNALRRQTVGIAAVVAQSVNVFQTGATGHHIVGDVEYVVGFEVRHMHLQQRDVPVDRCIESQSADHRMNRPNAAKAKGPAAFGHLIMNVGRTKHGLGLIAPKLARQSLLQFSCLVPGFYDLLSSLETPSFVGVVIFANQPIPALDERFELFVVLHLEITLVQGLGVEMVDLPRASAKI